MIFLFNAENRIVGFLFSKLRSCSDSCRLLNLHIHVPTHFIQPYIFTLHIFLRVCVSRLVALYEEGSECRHMFCVYVRESGGCILASSEQKSWFICRSLHSFIKISTNTTLSSGGLACPQHVRSFSVQVTWQECRMLSHRHCGCPLC